MLNEFQRSISAILYERVTSPLYGTFIVAWLIWNWKIPYVTFFVNADEIPGTKIEYIVAHYLNWWDGLVWPAVVTVTLLTVGQVLGYFALWFTLIVKQWKIERKQEIEKQQLLTVEQHAAIKKQLAEQQEEYKTMFADKDSEIRTLKESNNDYKASIARKNAEINALKQAGKAKDNEIKNLVESTKSYIAEADNSYKASIAEKDAQINDLRQAIEAKNNEIDEIERKKLAAALPRELPPHAR